MISIVSKKVIKDKTPEQIFRFFAYLNNKTFKSFHPSEHLYYKLLKRNPAIVGSEYIFVHNIAGHKLTHTWRVYSAKPYEHIFSKAKGILPIQLKLSFRKVAGGTEVLHEIHAGFTKGGFLSKMLEWIAMLTIFPKAQIAAFKTHSKEELMYLEKVV